MSRKTLLLTSLTVTCVLASLLTIPYATASSPTTWEKTYGGPNSDRAYAMIKTSDGGYALIGTTNSFGSGIINAWLVKTDADGNLQWNQTYSGIGQGIADSLVQTSDGGFALVGYTYSMVEGAGGLYTWLAKTNSTGSLQWNQTYSQLGTAIAYGVVQTSDGGFALVGGSNTLGSGGKEAWMAKTDSNGSLQWYKAHGGAGDDEMFSIVQTSDGGYALGGDTASFGSSQSSLWLVKTDSNGTVQWNQTYSGSGNEILSSMTKTNDGGYVLIGTLQSTGAGGDDFLLVKTDSSGNLQLNKTYGASSIDDALFGIQTNDGGYALVGVTNASTPAFAKAWLVKTDSAGTVQWNQTYGGSAQNAAGSIVQANDGGYVLAGFTNSTGAGGDDFWLIKTDVNGIVPEFPGIIVLSLFVILMVPIAFLVKKTTTRKTN